MDGARARRHRRRIDLSHWGTFLLVALVGQIIGVFVNIFWLNGTLYWVSTATGVALFSAFTAYGCSAG